MPIPIILGAIGAASAIYGAKKGYDAKCDFDEASEINQEAQESYDQAQKKLDRTRSHTNDLMEDLGHLKYSIYKTELPSFVETFKRIKNIDYKENHDLGDFDLPSSESILEIEENVLEVTEVVGGVSGALAGGAAAGFGAFGGAGLLASASTGTAISTLSGAAATNATLAWFGGGSLATGGLGMAGGTAVLGGIVAGPAIAVMGGLAAAKAEKLKNEAKSNLEKANMIVQEIKSVEQAVKLIAERVKELSFVLSSLNSSFQAYLEQLKDLVNKKTDYRKYNPSERKVTMVTAMLAKTIKELCEVSLLDDNGLTEKSKTLISEARNTIRTLEDI